MELSEILKSRRIAQKDLAEILGVSSQLVSSWCHGSRTITKEREEQIMKALDLKPVDLAVSVDPDDGRERVTVLRCKSCRYFVPSSRVCVVWNFHPVREDDYCSYARTVDKRPEVSK